LTLSINLHKIIIIIILKNKSAINNALMIKHYL